MRSVFQTSLLLVILAAAGWGTSELLYRSPVAQPVIARLLGRPPAIPALENLRKVSAGEQISEAMIDRELDLLRHQFADENGFVKALKSSGSSVAALRIEVTGHLRARQWIEKTIAPELGVTEAECRAFYDSAPECFALPERVRASHLFLATPQETPAEVFSAKRTLIQGLAIRILGGENFGALVVEASEDEETKNRGGDLGYFAAVRMPPEFVAEVVKLRVGELSAPIQSHLGFHILQLTDFRQPRPLGFDEAKAEIANTLENHQRARAVARLADRMNTAEFRGGVR